PRRAEPRVCPTSRDLDPRQHRSLSAETPMAAHIGAVLAEQQAVVSLLMKRLQAADYASAAAAETCAGALFSHLRVIERLVLPALSTSKNLQGTQAAVRMVAAQLASAVGEQERTGSMASYAELQTSVPLLFLAEGLLL